MIRSFAFRDETHGIYTKDIGVGVVCGIQWIWRLLSAFIPGYKAMGHPRKGGQRQALHKATPAHLRSVGRNKEHLKKNQNSAGLSFF